MNVFDMPFSKVYICLVQKAERKGKTRDEVDAGTIWLTGYAAEQLRRTERLSIERRCDLGGNRR